MGRLGQGLCEPSIGDNTFSIVELSKKIVKLDKPIYAGFTTIDLSKLLISGDLWQLSQDDASFSDQTGDEEKGREKGLVGWEKGFQLREGRKASG